MSCERFSDSGIKRRRKVEDPHEVKKETYLIEKIKGKRATLLTSDLSIALSAISEGFRYKIFISKLAQHEKHLVRTQDTQKVARLILISAVLFEQIRSYSDQK